VGRTKRIVATGKTENCHCSEGSQRVSVRMSDRAGWKQGIDLRSDDIRFMGN
jgi:hypothetical protein